MSFRIILPVLALILSACGPKHYVDLKTIADPSQTTSRADALFLAPANPGSLEAKMVEPGLRQELCKAGFVLASNPAAARWRLEYAWDPQRDRALETEFRPGFWGPIATTHPSEDAGGAAGLAVFPIAKDANTAPVWQAEVAGTDRELEEYQPNVWALMLDHFGVGYSEEELLSRDYRAAAEAAPPCHHKLP